MPRHAITLRAAKVELQPDVIHSSDGPVVVVMVEHEVTNVTKVLIFRQLHILLVNVMTKVQRGLVVMTDALVVLVV